MQGQQGGGINNVYVVLYSLMLDKVGRTGRIVNPKTIDKMSTRTHTIGTPMA